MPKSDMSTGALTPEMRKIINEWLAEKWTLSPNCPICGENSWSIQDKLAACVTLDSKGNVMLGGSFPSVAVICGNCAYTILFNAMVMGVLPKKEEGDDAGS